MYRELGTVGSVTGVRSGPYAGKARQVAIERLPAHVVERLTRALSGRGSPQVILRDRPARREMSGHRLLLIAGILVLVGDVLAWRVWVLAGKVDGVPPLALLVLGFLPAALAVVAGPALVLARMKREQGLPPTGRYLLPLDILEMDSAAGIMRVIPMGGVRRATVERERGSGLVLALLFEDGARYAFPVNDEQAAEEAYRLLEDAQTTLEDLTHTTDLELALDADPFFAVRSDDEWAALAPDVDAPRAERGRYVRPSRELVRLAAFAVAGAGLALAAGGARLSASDDALFQRAYEARDRALLERYLQLGGRQHRHETALLLEAFRQHDDRAAEAARAAREPPPAPRAEPLGSLTGLGRVPAAQLTPSQAAARREATDRALMEIDRLAATPQAVTILRAALAHANEAGDPELRVRFHRRVSDGTPASEPGHGWWAGARLDTFERTTIRALRVVLSETVPASPMAVTEARGPLPPDAPLLQVDYTIERRSARDVTFVFDVHLTAGAGKRVFRLTMPPPDEPLVRVRDRSLYRLADAGALVTEEALAARAFDRLYDELYGLLFAGNPRVPLGSDMRATFGEPADRGAP